MGRHDSVVFALGVVVGGGIVYGARVRGGERGGVFGERRERGRAERRVGFWVRGTGDQGGDVDVGGDVCLCATRVRGGTVAEGCRVGVIGGGVFARGGRRE